MIETIKAIKALIPLKSDKRAVTALEYGLIAAVIAGVVVGAFSLVGTNVNTVVSAVAAKVAT
jgi:pilus assembly protein Flp/PilA